MFYHKPFIFPDIINRTVCPVEEEKKFKVTIDFKSSLKFWLAYLIIQIIAILIAVIVLVTLLGIMTQLLPGYPLRILMTLTQILPNIP